MAVRLKVRIRAFKTEKEVTTASVANAGFESESYDVIIPLKLASQLGLSLEDSKEEVYKSAGGFVSFDKIPDALEVSIVTPDRESKSVKCSAVISRTEDEVIICDKLISELGVALEDVGKGLWRFRDEGVEKLRTSEEPKMW